MTITVTEELDGFRVRIDIYIENEPAGRALLYIIENDLHAEPYGLMEDVFVEESYRGKGISNVIVGQVLVEAKEKNCRKVIAQSRYSRPHVHALYKKYGFRDYGKNFRIDLV